MKMHFILRLTNGIRSGGDKPHLRGSGRLGHFVPTPPFTHILRLLVLLRKPLFATAKRRIPRTLYAICS